MNGVTIATSTLSKALSRFTSTSRAMETVSRSTTGCLVTPVPLSAQRRNLPQPFLASLHSSSAASLAARITPSQSRHTMSSTPHLLPSPVTNAVTRHSFHRGYQAVSGSRTPHSRCSSTSLLLRRQGSSSTSMFALGILPSLARSGWMGDLISFWSGGEQQGGGREPIGQPSRLTSASAGGMGTQGEGESEEDSEEEEEDEEEEGEDDSEEDDEGSGDDDDEEDERETVVSSLTRRDGGVNGSASRGANGAAASGGGATGGGGIAGVPTMAWQVEDVELHEEAVRSYVSYAMSVIVGRALPDVRDGLKPVHRRILYAMSEIGLASNKPFRKSARVVGEVLGKYHPHGDTAVYDALVRMAQDFSLRAPLVNGHGNFGSIDADPPAAMRYTECKLQALTEKVLLRDIPFDTVDFIPNFDSSADEPTVLPSRVPLLLVNGSQGIAVGMATNIPPHNLVEVVDGLLAVIERPEISIQELMAFCPGPDFPTGATILGTSGIEDAYTTGRGSIVVRGRIYVEEVAAGRGGSRSALVVTEVPYQTNKSALVEKIATLTNNKVIDGISDVRDESDRNGMRVVVELKRGATPLSVLSALYKHTPLQSRFSCNFVGLVNGEPKELNLLDFFKLFLDFRQQVVERRCRFLLRKAQERAHLVEGLVIGLQSIDLTVDILRSSPSAAAASEKLQDELQLSPIQADALLSTPLRRLTGMEVGKLEGELKDLTAEINKLNDTLASKQRILQIIKQEAIEMREEFGTPRRTRIETDLTSADVDPASLIPNSTILISQSERGFVKRLPVDVFTAQRRGTSGKSGGKLKADDALRGFVACRAHDSILFFSDRGIAYVVKGYQLPETSRTATGCPIHQIIPLQEGESVTSMLPVSDFSEASDLVMLTRKGFIKKTALQAFSDTRKNGLIAINLEEGDELRWVRRADEGDSLLIGSRSGLVLRFECNEQQLKRSSRKSQGARAMRLNSQDEVTAMDIMPRVAEESKANGPWILIVTRSGVGKRVPTSAFGSNSRNRKGLVAIKLSDEDSVAALHVVGKTSSLEKEADGSSSEEEEVLLGSEAGLINRIRVADISVYSRTSKGLRLMRLGEGDLVRVVSVVPSTELDPDGAPPLEQLVDEDTQSEAVPVGGD